MPTTPASLNGVPERPRDAFVNHYTELSKQVKSAGLLRRRYAYYWVKMSATTLSLALVAVGFAFLGNSWLQLLLGAALAIVFAQLAFLAHDAAHRQIFSSGRANEWAGLIQGTLLGGLSYGWWLNKHSRHHAHPNHVDRDPDVASGVLAFTPQARAKRRGLTALLADRQGYFFFPLLLLEGINLHVRSVQRILGRAPMRRRWWELGFLSIRLVGYVAALLIVLPPGKAAAFLGIQLGLYGLYLGCAFAPNHIGMPTVPANVKIDFLRRQVLMSRNVRGGRLVHYVLGGLDYQIEHHLFPNMPRPNLRHAQPLVRQLCRTYDIPYTEKTLPGSYGIIVRYLSNVGLDARDPFGCPLAAQLRSGPIARQVE